MGVRVCLTTQSPVRSVRPRARPAPSAQPGRGCRGVAIPAQAGQHASSRCSCSGELGGLVADEQQPDLRADERVAPRQARPGRRRDRLGASTVLCAIVSMASCASGECCLSSRNTAIGIRRRRPAYPNAMSPRVSLWPSWRTLSPRMNAASYGRRSCRGASSISAGARLMRALRVGACGARSCNRSAYDRCCKTSNSCSIAKSAHIVRPPYSGPYCQPAANDRWRWLCS